MRVGNDFVTVIKTLYTLCIVNSEERHLSQCQVVYRGGVLCFLKKYIGFFFLFHCYLSPHVTEDFFSLLWNSFQNDKRNDLYIGRCFRMRFWGADTEDLSLAISLEQPGHDKHHWARYLRLLFKTLKFISISDIK